MKEIKFRAWDKDLKEMSFYDFKTMTSHKGHMGSGMLKDIDGTEQDPTLKTFMQYTGLKDKKRTEEFPEGQEIYEGDVVKYFEFTMYPIQKVKIPEIYVHNFDDGEFYDGSTCIVIGNIHENKDLL